MESTQLSNESTVDIREKLAGKYLTFLLENEEYGLQILKVQEIIRLQEITSVPNTPDYVRGIINLRGRVVPVVALRKKFNMSEAKDTEKTCIVVVQVAKGTDTIVMGIIIDDVREVRDLIASEIEETPSFGTSLDIEFIMGVGKLEERVIMLLDIDKVLTKEQIEDIAAVKQRVKKE